MTSHSPTRSPLARRLLLSLALLGALPAAPLRAEAPPAKELTEEFAEGLGELRPLLDAKKYAESLALLDRLAAKVKPETYDFVILTQLQSQILLTQGELRAAVAPLEKSLAAAERYNFLPPATVFEQLYLLAQLYNQQAAEAKEPAVQMAAFDKSFTYVQRALPLAPKPTAELQLLAASLLYNQGSLGAKPDPAKFRASIAEARKGLVLAVKPPEQLYQLMLASHQQLGELEQAAETLELIVRARPNSAQSWPQLVALYLNLAGTAPDDAVRERCNLRAALTIERAQALGFLQSPAENYTLAALHFTLRDFARAAALLERGLKNGTIESVRRNWELLANCYQQLNEEDHALAALARAAAVFPDEGQFEFAMAQIHYAQNRTADAYRHAQTAFEKGRLDKPGQTLLYLAYLGYELGKLDAASQWLDRAAGRPDVKESEIAPLRRAVGEAAKDRTPHSKT